MVILERNLNYGIFSIAPFEKLTDLCYFYFYEYYVTGKTLYLVLCSMALFCVKNYSACYDYVWIESDIKTVVQYKRIRGTGSDRYVQFVNVDIHIHIKCVG